MTRINSAIPVKCLTDEHLLAEHREIKRLPYCLRKAIVSGSIDKIPGKFTLGKGHVLFFLDKMSFVLGRYSEIYYELIHRGFDVQDYSDNWKGIDSKYFNKHNCTLEEKKLLIDRISDRIMNSKKKCWHYYGKTISKEDAVGLLK
jgi:hypothetical protein